MDGQRRDDSQKLVKTIVVLMRNTTWRCGKLERLIVKHLCRRSTSIGKPWMSIKELIQSFRLKGKRKNEFLDAIKRLERRNIIRIARM